VSKGFSKWLREFTPSLTMYESSSGFLFSLALSIVSFLFQSFWLLMQSFHNLLSNSKLLLHSNCVYVCVCVCVCVCGSGVWTQGLHLEPLHQPCFYDGFFQDRVSRTICLDWHRTMIFLISASRVARIISMSHWCPAKFLFLYWHFKNHLSSWVYWYVPVIPDTQGLGLRSQG
jgi:hypothetical protein